MFCCCFFIIVIISGWSRAAPAPAPPGTGCSLGRPSRWGPTGWAGRCEGWRTSTPPSGHAETSCTGKKRCKKIQLNFVRCARRHLGGQRDANSMRSNWVCLAKSTCLRLYCPLLSQLGMWRAYRSSRGPRLSLKGILDILSRIWSSSCWHWVWTTKEKGGHSDRCGYGHSGGCAIFLFFYLSWQSGNKSGCANKLCSDGFAHRIYVQTEPFKLHFWSVAQVCQCAAILFY